MSVSNYVELGVIALLTAERAAPGLVQAARKLKAPTSLQALADDIADIKGGVGLLGIAFTEAKALAPPTAAETTQPMPAVVAL